jgi:hypothetical protein
MSAPPGDTDRADSAPATLFVVTASERTREAAAAKVKDSGGWLLDTNLAPGLTPDLFAVVRGPFKTMDQANAVLAALKMETGFSGAFVKDGGKLRIPVQYAALLGQFTVATIDRLGSENNPCAPQEPFTELEASYEQTTPDGQMTSTASLSLGSFWIVKSTGEVNRAAVCGE